MTVLPQRRARRDYPERDRDSDYLRCPVPARSDAERIASDAREERVGSTYAADEWHIGNGLTAATDALSTGIGCATRALSKSQSDLSERGIIT